MRLALIVALCAAGCADTPDARTQTPPIPAQGVAPVRTPLPQASSPPRAPASREGCRKACERVAAIALRAEALSLDALVPGAAPPAAKVAPDIPPAIERCTSECALTTPAPVVACLAAAEDPGAVEGCLKAAGSGAGK